MEKGKVSGDGKEKVSFVVPVYNGAEYLSRCVESLLAQTWPHMEILLVDDGSDDGSGRMCDEFAGRYKEDGEERQNGPGRYADIRIKAYHIENSGVSAARNKGLEECGGDYISFVDADDCLRPDMAERLVKMLQETDSDVAGCGYFAFQGRVQDRLGEDGTDGNPETVETLSGEEFVEKGILRSDTRCWSKLYKRECIGGLRFTENLTIGEDMLFLLELARRGKKFCRSGYKGYGYYINDNGAMRKGFQGSYMDQILCWQKALGCIEKEMPGLADRAATIVLISVMLVVGKLAALPGKERKANRKYADICSRLVKEYSGYGGAYRGLDGGYRIKVRLYRHAPRIYMALYHWKSKKQKG